METIEIVKIIGVYAPLILKLFSLIKENKKKKSARKKPAKRKKSQMKKQVN